MNNIEFSIIIPVYKVERYINKCVDSLISQTLTNYEIILVDDGSPDNCPKICDEIVAKDSRIKCIHKNNGGLSSARNEGLKIATGNYVIFVDSDDYIDDNTFLDKLQKLITRHHPDVVMYKVKKLFENTNVLEEKTKNNMLSQISIIENLIKFNYYKACACDKAIKRDIILKNKIHFPLNKLSEDIEWCAQLLKSIDLNKIAFLDESPYVYLQHEGSITKSVGEKNIRNIIEMIEKNCILDPKTYQEKIINNYLAYEYSVLLGLMKIKSCNNKIDKNLQLRVYNYKWLLNYHLSNKVKKVFLLSKIIGIRASSYILGIFIDWKNRGMV